MAEKLRWLNQKLNTLFLYAMKQMTDRSNGHVVRTYSDRRIDAICEDVWEKTSTKPYCEKEKGYI